MARSASVVEKADATVFAVGEPPILSNFARSAADHSAVTDLKPPTGYW
jgi:hypothetical protein